jgi:AraC family transcriptional regulator
MPTPLPDPDCGELYAQRRARRCVGGFIVTEGTYPPGLQLPRHEHELASLCLVLAGGYVESFGRHTRYAEPGSLIIHPAGERHSNRHGPLGAHLLVVEVAAAALPPLAETARLFAQAADDRDTSLTRLAAELCVALREPDAIAELTTEALVLEILGRARQRNLPTPQRTPWLLAVRDYLDAHPASAPRPAQLAQLAGVHPVYLARAFRRTFGCSMGQYARRAQLLLALRLLEDETLSLAAVAHQAGFADQSHMTRRLRAHTGATPRTWRAGTA